MGNEIARNGDMIPAQVKGMKKSGSWIIALRRNTVEKIVSSVAFAFVVGLASIGWGFSSVGSCAIVLAVSAIYPSIAYADFHSEICNRLHREISRKDTFHLYLKYVTRRHGSAYFNKSPIHNEGAKVFEVHRGKLEVHDYIVDNPIDTWHEMMATCVKSYKLNEIKEQRLEDKLLQKEQEYEELLQQYHKDKLKIRHLPWEKLSQKTKDAFRLVEYHEYSRFYEVYDDDDYFYEESMDGTRQCQRAISASDLRESRQEMLEDKIQSIKSATGTLQKFIDELNEQGISLSKKK